MMEAPGEGLKRALILVADDDDLERLLIREALQKAGFEVAEVANGIEAVEATKRLVPAMVFLDVFMPELDGFAACAMIRQLRDGEHLPIVLVTGADDTDSIERAFNVGATDFMAKPLNWPLLGHRARYIHRASQSFRETVERRAELAEAQRIAQLGSWHWDPRQDMLQLSREALHILGWPPEARSVSLLQILESIRPEDEARVKSAISDAIRERSGLDLEFGFIRPDGSEQYIAARAKFVRQPTEPRSLFKGTLQDITARKAAEAQLNHMAHHDALTDLPNRVLFRERFEHAIARAKRDEAGVAAICLDLDRFKDVNDTLGHAVGDRLLQAVSDRLLAEVRGGDTVARLGGDEFAVIQVGIHGQEQTMVLADRLVSTLSEPFEIDGQVIGIGGSAGVSFYPDDGDDATQLLMNADIAMYEAKTQGRSCARVYATGMGNAIRERKTMERDIRTALEQGWFEVHYQPQVDVDTNTVCGAEALVRMRHPTRGLLPPQDFIPLAEETGLIVPLGIWILREACFQTARWRANGAPIRVAVNLSPVQFRQTDLITAVHAALQHANLDPSFLELEITESMLMHETATTLATLQKLRALGVRIAMDDFGTGYSSLSYLKLFPFDRIKIDRSFIRELAENRDAAAIVKAIVGLGRSLHMETTAEGVETLAQMTYLKAEACDEVQGFYFGRPMNTQQFTAFLHEKMGSESAAKLANSRH